MARKIDTLVIATHNPGKAKAIAAYLQDMPFAIKTLNDLGITEDVEETGSSFEENSELKARFFYKLTGLPTLSDDGGLEIDSLNGEPGVKSRRWPGHEATDEELIAIMQQKLQNVPEEQRTAQFVGVITVMIDEKTILQARGVVRGIMLQEPHIPPPQGLPWSGYFYIPELDKVHGEITPAEARQYSHRGIGIKKIKEQLQPYV